MDLMINTNDMHDHFNIFTSLTWVYSWPCSCPHGGTNLKQITFPYCCNHWLLYLSKPFQKIFSYAYEKDSFWMPNILDHKSIAGLIFFSKNQLLMYFSSIWLQSINRILFNLPLHMDDQSKFKKPVTFGYIPFLF